MHLVCVCEIASLLCSVFHGVSNHTKSPGSLTLKIADFYQYVFLKYSRN